MKHFLWSVFFVFFSALPIAAQVGKTIADFSLQDLEGTTHTPARYRGQVLVLFFMGHN